VRPQTVANNRRATLSDTIAIACAGILDLIDVDRPERTPTPRNPSRQERDRTDRADGRFQPSPTGPSRRIGVSRPVEQAVLAWERRIQHAVNDLQTLALEWDDLRRPISTVGPEPSQAAARRHVIDLSVWLHATAMEACDRLDRVDGEAWQHWRERTDLMLRQVSKVSRRWAADRPQAQPCKCVPACGLWLKRGNGATHPVCRKRRQRQRTEDAA
jgi:hypothetical protein